MSSWLADFRRKCPYLCAGHHAVTISHLRAYFSLRRRNTPKPTGEGPGPGTTHSTKFSANVRTIYCPPYRLTIQPLRIYFYTCIYTYVLLCLDGIRIRGLTVECLCSAAVRRKVEASSNTLYLTLFVVGHNYRKLHRYYRVIIKSKKIVLVFAAVTLTGQ